MAHAAGMKLDRGNTGLLHGLGVDGAVDIGLHDSPAKPAGESPVESEEGCGFSAARRGHQVQQAGSAAVQLIAKHLRILIIVFEDGFLQGDDLYFVHDGFLSEE